MMGATSILIRPRAWWYNKVPLSVTLCVLLLDGRRFTVEALIAFVAVVLAVCAVGNVGYAVNEIFDIDEDARLGRINAAAGVALSWMWSVVAGSALCAGIFGGIAAGPYGALLSVGVLCLPLAYSAPPVRIKERKWLGVAADALAAHVYPATLALVAVAHWALRPVPSALAVAVVVWAVAAGLRGILSHQLATSEQDRNAGLQTVVHDLGNRRLERLVIGAILPLEAAAFVVAIVLCDTGIVLWIGGGLYLLYELFKTLSGTFRVSAFRPEGQAYVPFVEESFYKAWGPVVLALDAARVDLFYLLVIPAYVLLFRPHMRAESQRLLAVWAALRAMGAREPSDRSNAGS